MKREDISAGADLLAQASKESFKQFTASGIVLGPNRTILLVDHRKLESWVYPGGHVKWYETPDKAVLREVLEETGIRVSLLPRPHRFAFEKDELLHSPYVVLCEPIDFPPEPVHHHVDLVYLCEAVPEDRNKPLRPYLSEVSDARYVGSHEIENLKMMPDIRTLLQHLFADDAVWELLKVDSLRSN